MEVMEVAADAVQRGFYRLAGISARRPAGAEFCGSASNMRGKEQLHSTAP